MNPEQVTTTTTTTATDGQGRVTTTTTVTTTTVTSTVLAAGEVPMRPASIIDDDWDEAAGDPGVMSGPPRPGGIGGATPEGGTNQAATWARARVGAADPRIVGAGRVVNWVPITADTAAE